MALILPRPGDEHLRGEKVKLVNMAVQDWCSQEGIICLRTYNHFLKGAKANRALFRKGLDYLHPNKLGNLKVTEFLRCQLSDRQIHQRLGPLGH